jgi:hypothetical protein
LSERQRSEKWMTALATLVLLLFSACGETGISKTLERPLHLALPGLGSPAQSNEASNVAATGGRTLWVTNPTKVPGSKKSVAVLDGHKVQHAVLIASRSRQIILTESHDFAFVRITSARAPPAPAFAI